jgi:hypothetical protein
VPRRPSTAVAAVATVVVGAMALVGCAGPEESGPPAARVSAWVSTAGGGAAIGTVEVDSANIDHAIAHHSSPAALKTVCALLTNDAETAIGNLPTPDTQLTDDLNNAYQDGAAAGDDCFKGASGSEALMRRSATERTKLVPLLALATDRMSALTGHTPSTSTTQPAPDDDPFG